MSVTDKMCPICEEGVLEERVESNEVERNGVVQLIPLRFSVCTECSSEQGSADQALSNKKAMMSFVEEAAAN